MGKKKASTLKVESDASKELSDEQAMMANLLFATLDKDGGGALSKSELKNGLNLINAATVENRPWAPLAEQLKKAMNAKTIKIKDFKSFFDVLGHGDEVSGGECLAADVRLCAGHSRLFARAI